MKPIPIFVLVAAFSMVTVAASAKNETAPGSTNERMISGVAGPTPTPNSSKRTNVAKGEQPSKTTLKKAKVQPKPVLQDPN